MDVDPDHGLYKSAESSIVPSVPGIGREPGM